MSNLSGPALLILLLSACTPSSAPPTPTADEEAAEAEAGLRLPTSAEEGSKLARLVRERISGGEAAVMLHDEHVRGVVMDARKTRLSVVERGRGTFTAAALAADEPDHVDVTINGMLYSFEEEVHRLGSRRPTADGAHGIAMSRGKVLGGQPLLSDTARYHLAQHRLPEMSAWRVDRGDPQGTGTGLGGARLLLLGRTPFGAPDGTPDRDTDHLMDIPASLGMPYTGIDRDLGLLWILVKQSDATNTVAPEDDPLSVGRVRTVLSWVGVDDALVWDGGDSATLVVDDQVLEAPAAYKDNSIPFGLRFTTP